MTSTTDAKRVVPAPARADLERRSEAARRAAQECDLRGDRKAADAHWREHIGCLEVLMGRSSRVDKLTMTPSPVADVTAPQGHREP